MDLSLEQLPKHKLQKLDDSSSYFLRGSNFVVYACIEYGVVPSSNVRPIKDGTTVIGTTSQR